MNERVENNDFWRMGNWGGGGYGEWAAIFIISYIELLVSKTPQM